MDAGKTKTTLTFTVTSAAGARQEVVTQDIVKIGKDPKSHLRLDDEAASRMHAVVEVAGVDDITLIDLGNEPGTLVNGQRINKTKVKAGDEIRIGETRIVLLSAAPAELGAPVAAPAAAANPFAAAAPAANPFGSGGDVAANPFGGASPFGGGASPFGSPFGAPGAGTTNGHGHGHAHAEDDPNAEYTYRLVKTGPDVSSDEVERAGVPAVEVMVLWDATILHVAHLTPPRSFYVGEEEGKNVGVDYRMPSEKLGSTRMPVLVAAGGSAAAVLPPGAKGSIDVPGQGKLTLDEARAKGMVQPCSELSGADQIVLPPNGRVRVEFNGFVFQTAAVAAGKKPKGALNKSSRAGLVFWLASFALHAGVITALMMSPGESLDDDAAGLDKSTQAYMLQLQKNAADKEIPEQEDTSQNNAQQDKSGGTGTRHKGAEGMMGDPSKNMTGGYYQIKGPPDTAEVKIAKTRALIEAGNYGAIGALSSVFGSTANAPIAFDSDSNETIGRDPNNFNGNLMGDHPGDSFGYGGLGMTGTGPGGGGWGDGIGLGTVGGFGHGAGTGTGMGYGGGGGRVGTGRKTKVVKMIETGTDIQGRLPPEVIKRIIRANFPRFRACYEQGLKKDPGLKGTVAVRFIIDTTGAVESANLSGGSMSDSQVSSCVLGVYRTLSFPEPEGGKVMVTYPIDFQNEE
ncbi:MAG: AgmX/PglI C-terminal domain-containing protein [Deltaproteobacteria bacterium]|nr:AgmX/PglI C-terminal domain-containing protein [Deltaproteobacteria bacterium]